MDTVKSFSERWLCSNGKEKPKTLHKVFIISALCKKKQLSHKIITFEVKVDKKKVTVVNPVFQELYIQLLYNPFTGD